MRKGKLPKDRLNAQCENKDVGTSSQSGLIFPEGAMEFKSQAMQTVYARIKQVAPLDQINCLLLGATGVGKDIIANLIHNNSQRKDKKILKANCAHFRGDLLLSELFGSEPGAYTNAPNEGRAGLFENANDGTVFLDEIAEIPLEYQADLLRTLDEQLIKRVGGNKEIGVNVRIIAATNVDLWERVEKGEFREDLYYRLCGYRIGIPQLRESREDIPALTEYFRDRFEQEYKGGLTVKIKQSALNHLKTLDWPGNVRELKNVVEATIVNSSTGEQEATGKQEVEITLQEVEITLQEFRKTHPDVGPNLGKKNREKIILPSELWDQILEASPIVKKKVDNPPPNASDPKITLSAYCCTKRYDCDWDQVKGLYNERGVSQTSYNRLFESEIDANKLKVEKLINTYAKYRDMVHIPAGTFYMGSNEEETKLEDDDAKPRHKVYVDGFFIDKCVVTNEEYLVFLGENPQWKQSGIMAERFCDADYLRHWENGSSFPEEKKKHPVIYISWYAAMAYTKWIGKRLPTEAEWEKAARGGLEKKIYPWGNTIDSGKANYRAKGSEVHLETAYSYAPNNYQLYNMAGNVWEWCLDDYEPDFYENSPFKNPIATKQSLQSIVDNFESVNPRSPAASRGGSFADWYQTLRVFQRNGNTRTLTNMSLGFRCVRDETGEEQNM